MHDHHPALPSILRDRSASGLLLSALGLAAIICVWIVSILPMALWALAATVWDILVRRPSAG
jgi:hypothetical protein